MNSGKPCVSLLCFLCSALFFLYCSAWCQEASFAQKLYGDWYMYPPGNPNTDPVRHQFRHDPTTSRDEMVVIRRCPTADSRVVTAKVVSPIEVSQDQIRILKSASDAQPTQGTSVCEASITAGAFSYSFSEDDHLVLTNPGGNPDFLELAREVKNSGADFPQRLYGTWLLPPVEGKTMRVQLRWVFYTTAEHQDKLRQIAVCSKGNDSLVSHVDSDVSLKADEIKVLQSASHEQHEGDFICQSSLIAGTWRYSLASSGVTVTLYASGAKPITLTREPQPGLN